LLSIFPGAPLEVMELFLNLAWTLLALPAYWLWRSARGVRSQRHFSSLQCLLALASVLVLLFPVISATDDLLAMRAEIEESAPGKRTIRQAGADRCSVCNTRFQGPAVLLATAASFTLDNEQWLTRHRPSLFVRDSASILRASRAPPSSPLA
jgi:hypothetical protein